MGLADDWLIICVFFQMIIIHLPVWEPTIVNKDIWFIRGQREAESVISEVDSNTWSLISCRTGINIGSLLSFLSARRPQWSSLGLYSKAIGIKRVEILPRSNI